jgi:hypothetical protein
VTDERIQEMARNCWRDVVADAQEVEVHWREAQYQLGGAPTGSAAAERLRAETEMSTIPSRPTCPSSTAMPFSRTVRSENHAVVWKIDEGGRVAGFMETVLELQLDGLEVPVQGVQIRRFERPEKPVRSHHKRSIPVSACMVRTRVPSADSLSLSRRGARRQAR